MSYKVIRNIDGGVVAFGPNDDNYAPVVKQGEAMTIEEQPPVLPATIPQVVAMPQARKALILSGVSIAQVDATINAIVDDTQRELAQTDWEYSATVRRDSPLVVTLGPLLDLTDAEIDDLFVLAATL